MIHLGAASSRPLRVVTQKVLLSCVKVPMVHGCNCLLVLVQARIAMKLMEALRPPAAAGHHPEGQRFIVCLRALKRWQELEGQREGWSQIFHLFMYLPQKGSKAKSITLNNQVSPVYESLSLAGDSHLADA